MMKLIGLILWAARARTFDPTAPEEGQHPRKSKIHGAPPDARPTCRRPANRRRFESFDATYADADAAPVVVQPPDSSVALQEFGYAVAYASGRLVVGARELGDDKVGAAFLYSL